MPLSYMQQVDHIETVDEGYLVKALHMIKGAIRAQ